MQDIDLLREKKKVAQAEAKALKAANKTAQSRKKSKQSSSESQPAKPQRSGPDDETPGFGTSHLAITVTHFDHNSKRWQVSAEREAIEGRPDITLLYGYSPNPAGAMWLWGQRAKLFFDPVTHAPVQGKDTAEFWFAYQGKIITATINDPRILETLKGSDYAKQ